MYIKINQKKEKNGFIQYLQLVTLSHLIKIQIQLQK